MTESQSDSGNGWLQLEFCSQDLLVTCHLTGRIGVPSGSTISISSGRLLVCANQSI